MEIGEFQARFKRAIRRNHQAVCVKSSDVDVFADHYTISYVTFDYRIDLFYDGTHIATTYAGDVQDVK
ncbi:MAG: hypothetical protein QXW75_00555 [Thermoplasmatales archaeon]